MKLLILPLCALCAAVANGQKSPTLEAAALDFGTWANVHGKTYASSDEKLARKATFEANRQKVIVHNAEYEAGKHSFYLGLNHLADMELDEYRKTMLGFRASSSSSSLLAAKTHQSNSTPPASWDWRNTQNVVGPVKNQGQCGSCWAFSAVATMEGALNLNTKKIHSLSEQELVDCVNGGQDTCNQGGQMYDGVEYGVTHGMEAEADYSYQGTSGHKCAFSASKSVHKFSGYVNITSGDEKALTNAAWEKPIISVGIDASSFWFQLYSGGVFDLKSCKNGINDLDHGVAVVGYGTLNGKDYYIVRNSWGAFWGQKGYILMSRGASNQCGIATQACYAEL